MARIDMQIWRWLDVRDVLALFGLMAIIYGLAQWSKPATWILVGLCAVVLAFGPDLRRRRPMRR